MDRSLWRRQLDKQAALAQTNKWRRAAALPLRYARAQVFNHLVYPLIRKGRLAEACAFFGDQMQVRLPAGTDLFLLGIKSHDSEVRLARYLLHALLPGMHMADVGAHFGYFTLLGGRCVGPNGSVTGFEAASATHTLLASNTAALPCITTINAAVSSEAGTLEFTEFPTHFSEFNTLNPNVFAKERWFGAAQPRRVQVKALSLDAYYAEREPPHLVKIDVEGAEDQVVAGMQGLLTHSKPIVIMECWGPQRSGGSHTVAQQRLSAAGYHAFFINPEGEIELCPNPAAYLAALPSESDNLVFIG